MTYEQYIASHNNMTTPLTREKFEEKFGSFKSRTITDLQNPYILAQILNGKLKQTKRELKGKLLEKEDKEYQLNEINNSISYFNKVIFTLEQTLKQLNLEI